MNKSQKRQIIGALGVSHLSEPQQEEVMGLIMENVSAKISLVVWDTFLQEHKKSLKTMNQLGNEKLLRYVSSKIKNFPKLVEKTTKEAVEDFKRKRAQMA